MRERSTRFLSATVSLLLLSLILVTSADSAEGGSGKAPDVVRARAIELVDERGQVRASLEIESSGEAVFRMRDAQGAIRVKLGASESGSGLLLLDDRTEPALHLLASGDATTLTLAQEGKEKRVLAP